MSNHSTRMSHKALAAIMAGAGLALAACGSTAQKSSLPVSKAPSNSIGHNSGSPSSFSLAQLESLAPFDTANQLPIYNGDPTQLDPSWQDPQIPLPSSHIGVPTVLRVPKPEVLKAWVVDTAVPYVGPIYVGKGLTPLERDAAYTAVTFNALAWTTSATPSVEEVNGKIAVRPQVAVLYQPYAGNGPVPAQRQLACMLSTTTSGPCAKNPVAPTYTVGVTANVNEPTYNLDPSTLLQALTSTHRVAVHATAKHIEVAVCSNLSSGNMVNGKETVYSYLTQYDVNIVGFANTPASLGRPLEPLFVYQYAQYTNGSFYNEDKGEPAIPQWAKVCPGA
jgi:hypothetical protein